MPFVTRRLIPYVLCLLSLAGLPACQTVPAEGDIIRANTVLVLPADTLHKELERFGPDVQKRLAAALGKQGFRVTLLDAAAFAAIHGEALTVSGSVYDPGIGKLMPMNRNAYTKAVVDLAREQQRFDVVVMPEVILRPAQTVGDEAHWDGMEREYTWVQKPKVTYTLPGKASGLSLRMDVYTDSGSKVLVNFAGISLPYHLRYDEGKFYFDLKEAYFTDKELGESIEMSLKVFSQQVIPE